MKIETSQITKLVLSDLGDYKLDPVTVILEDIGPHQLAQESNRGKVIIECYGQSWTAYWGNMSKLSVSQFIQGTDDEYLIGCLAPGLCRTRFSGPALTTLARKVIIQRRRGRDCDLDALNAKDARRLYKASENFRHAESTDQAFAHNGTLVQDVFGIECWFYVCRAVEPNPDYDYLRRIVNAVRDGLAQLEGVANRVRNETSQSAQDE